MERESETLSAAEAESLVSWWTEAGVDVLIADAPRDWLNEKPAAAPTRAPAVSSEAPADDEAPPAQLELFRAWLASSDKLPFSSPNTPRVCPAGDPGAGLMIVADMPSGEDCAAGTLMSGEVGALFDNMLKAIGRDRETIYLTALSCIRSPSGQLNSEAAQRCAALARHHIGLAAPRAVLLFGDACAKALLGLPVAQARGRWHEIATHGGPVKALATIGPKQLLDAPRLKALAWSDLQMLMEEVNG